MCLRTTLIAQLVWLEIEKDLNFFDLVHYQFRRRHGISITIYHVKHTPLPHCLFVCLFIYLFDIDVNTKNRFTYKFYWWVMNQKLAQCANESYMKFEECIKIYIVLIQWTHSLMGAPLNLILTKQKINKRTHTRTLARTQISTRFGPIMMEYHHYSQTCTNMLLLM